MYIILEGVMEITFIIIYIPQAERPIEEKEKVYEILQEVFEKRKSKGPIYIMGDWNARLTYPDTQEEENG